MSADFAETRLSTLRLILVPSIISLLVTLLRLIGELKHWSEDWFSTDTMGIVPSRMTWLIGITWLIVPFSAYFAWKLTKAGRAPESVGRAFLVCALGLMIVIIGLFYLRPFIPLGFPSILLYIWAVMVVAAILQWFAWRALFKVNLAYGLAARIPVVMVMILAMRGNWGTHYDFTGMPEEFQMQLIPRILWLAVFPQLVFWVGFTILLGTLSGLITVAIFSILKPAAQTAKA